MGLTVPLNHLILMANSVADDLGFVALADLSRVLRDAGSLQQTRIIGGQMVMLHAQRWGLGRELYRESRDADLGIAPISVKDGQITTALMDAGYKRESGNRYVRRVIDIPLRLKDEKSADTEAAIDILTPAYTSRPRDNVKISDELTTTEVPGLAIALKRPGIELEIELLRLNDTKTSVRLVVPDEVATVVLKTLAWKQRAASRDAVDIWRALEIAFAAGLTSDDFRGSWGGADRVLLMAFDSSTGAAMNAIAQGSLNTAATQARHTRIRALIERFI